jgi:multicomponent K+:H+ antiporter subunit A
MVKAGIFLLGRLWPVLAGTEAWFLIVTLTGLVTMVIAAWIALYKDDLKALLAFSTVSHLGLVTMLFGMGTPIAAVTAVFHILNHCTFKAALFLSAGIVDHETGTRDARRLGGLLRLMPITGTLAMVAAASMAGLPLLNGFLSKEMMLEAAAHTEYLGRPWLVPALATLGALLSVAYSFRFVTAVFLGRARNDYPHHPHDPPPGMWLPVAVLVVPVVLIGVAPPIVEPVVDLAARAVVGGPLPDYHLAIWHGVTPALFMSVVAIAGGVLLLSAHRRASAIRLALPRPEAKSVFDGLIAALVGVARALTDSIHNGSLQRSLLLAILVMLAMGITAFLGAPYEAGARAQLGPNLPAVALWILAAAAGLGVMRFHRHRFLALVLTSIVGLVVSLTFVYFSAPDLGLTQLSVEVVTTVLMLLALNYLPQKSPPEPSRFRRWRDFALSVAGGLGVGAMLYAVLTRDLTETIATWHVDQSKPGGGGTNVVNVILVDFRGYDTFGEIIVLAIAALAIFALLDSALSGSSGQRLAHLPHRRESGDRHPLMLVVVTRALLPLALTVGIFILLRGHNMPGGGFVAGLVIGVALIMQYMASGYAWADRQMKIDYHELIGLGVLAAGITGIGAWYGDLPFLTSGYDYFHLPIVGEIELATAMAFDLGVFLTVVGVVMLILANLSRIGRKAEPAPEDEGPMDIVLAEPPLPVEGR